MRHKDGLDVILVTRALHLCLPKKDYLIMRVIKARHMKEIVENKIIRGEPWRGGMGSIWEVPVYVKWSPFT